MGFAVAQALAQLTNYAVLHSFGPTPLSGRDPDGDLIESADGSLYGTTSTGGSNNYGTVFKVSKDGSGFTVLHGFRGSPSEGREPSAGVVEGRDGVLYGTTYLGGVSNTYGTIYRLNRDGSGYAVLHNFTGPAGDGHYPWGELVEAGNGVFYGTTSSGVGNRGTVYRMNADGGGYQSLHAFAGSPTDGDMPKAALLVGGEGVLYGTTYWGGTAGWGTVFAVSPEGSNSTVLHAFQHDLATADEAGAWPNAALLEGSDGALYGTTWAGGLSNSCDCGTVFRLTKDGSLCQTLHIFSGSNGAYPGGALIEGSDGALYGTTTAGGDAGAGTLYKLNPNGSGFQVLHHFAGNPRDGRRPYAGLVRGRDGAFYGTTSAGGTWDLGTIFRFGHALSLTQPPGRIILGLTGIPGCTYELERSSDLVTWTNLATSTIPPGATLPYEDPSPPPVAAFYRLRVP